MHFHRFIGECSKFLIHLNDKKSISKSISCLSIHSGGPLICLHPSSSPVEIAHNVDLAGEDRVWRDRTRISDSIPSFDISTFPLFLARTTGELGHRTRMGQINHLASASVTLGRISWLDLSLRFLARGTDGNWRLFVPPTARQYLAPFKAPLGRRSVNESPLVGSWVFSPVAPTHGATQLALLRLYWRSIKMKRARETDRESSGQFQGCGWQLSICFQLQPCWFRDFETFQVAANIYFLLLDFEMSNDLCDASTISRTLNSIKMDTTQIITIILRNPKQSNRRATQFWMGAIDPVWSLSKRKIILRRIFLPESRVKMGWNMKLLS